MTPQTVRHRYGPAIFRFAGALLCAITLSVSVAAFKPKAELGHVGIVKAAITPITRTLSTGEVLRFSADAIAQIREATAAVDEPFGERGELVNAPKAHCDDETLLECTNRLIDLKASVIALAREQNGGEARRQLGRALHTLQDFYSHSNWVNLTGGGSLNPKLGKEPIEERPRDVATCVDDLFDNKLTGEGLTKITTGYFFPTVTPPNKCAHGGLLAEVGLPGGIHKDQPGRPFFDEAFAVAIEATLDYVNQILNALAGEDAAIRALMQSRGTLGFVIDDTGSMGGVIASIKTVIGLIVAGTTTPGSQPDNYLLQTFNDPTIGPTYVTGSAATLLSAVNSIIVGGGDDCPELSQAGLLAAISRAAQGSRLYFFSDAPAKDAALAGNVIAEANKKKVTIHYILSNGCGPVDPVYVRGAQETGGQVFNLTATEIAKLFALIQPTLTGDLQPLLTISKTSVPAGTYSYGVPVDSTMTSVTFSVSLTSASAIRVRRPGGLEVLASDADATVTTLSTGRIVTVKAPAAGDWRLELTGSGDLSASVMGNSPLQLASVGFVEQRGREEHKGPFPIDGQPVLGDPHVMLARVQGTVTSVRFDAVGADGTTLDALALSGSAEVASDEYVGPVSPPSGKFRVYARGLDAKGFAFVRAYPALFGVQSVRVRAKVAGAHLRTGQTNSVAFDVTNVGPAGSFAITASDSERFISSVSPSTLTLPSGGVGTVTVDLAVPDSPAASLDSINVVARSTADASVSNSATIDMLISSAKILSVTPDTAAPGETRDISITGQSTNWASGLSALSFSGSGISVNDFTVTSATTATAKVTIAPGALAGTRDMVITTGGETAALANAFTISAVISSAKIVSVTPETGAPGETLSISIAGESTHWADGASVLSFSGTEITVNNLSVTSPTTATANITIAPGALAGSRDALMTTGRETAALANAFTVAVPLTLQPPTGVYASSIVGNLVTFRWTPPVTGLTPTNYIVEGGVVPGQVLASITTGSIAPVFTVSAPSGAFYVRMHTVSGTSRSVASNEIRIFVNSPAAPSAPLNLLARASGSSLGLSWRNTFDGGRIDSMILDVTGPVSTSVTLPANESASFTGLSGGTYTFRLRATNAFGSSAASNAVVVTFPAACTGVPQAPTEFLAFNTGNRVSTYWAPPPAGNAAESYELIVTGGINLVLPTTQRSLSGSVPPGFYNLSVRGINACGGGAATAVTAISVIP